MRALTSVLTLSAALLPAACGAGGASGDDLGTIDASPAFDAAALDGEPGEPGDPVVDVPAATTPYAFGKLSTDDFQASSGTWFTEATTEHKIFGTRVTYARYRDNMLLQDAFAQRFFLYDQVATTVGPAIEMPSDAIGPAAIRGGVVYAGGLGKVYSYEIATGMWRQQALAGAGSCTNVVAGSTRLFVRCADPTVTGQQLIFTTWANLAMSDVVPLGAFAEGASDAFTWITAAPGQDIAFVSSDKPTIGCIGRATATTFAPCAIDVRALNGLSGAFVAGATASEDGTSLYVELFFSGNDDHSLTELNLATMSRQSIGTIEAYATCPDNSVITQNGTFSKRYAGGVFSDVRLGSGGDHPGELGCPLRPLGATAR